MLLTLAVVLPTPHDYSSTFMEGTIPGYVASRRVLKEARKASSVSLASTCDLPVTTSVDPMCL